MTTGALQEFIKTCYNDSGCTDTSTAPMLNFLKSFRQLARHNGKNDTVSILFGIYGVRFALTGEFDVVIDYNHVLSQKLRDLLQWLALICDTCTDLQEIQHTE